MKKSTFIALSIIGTILALIVLTVAIFIEAQNTAINLEEQINESASSIEIQEKRREDLIYNLADTVQAYDKHESGTLAQLIAARSSAAGGNIEDAQMAIQAVAEAYPDLKSQANYQALMNELAVTENLIAEHRNNFNLQVKSYNKHIRTFPNSLLLGAIGYEAIDIKYLEYEAASDAPMDLFGE